MTRIPPRKKSTKGNPPPPTLTLGNLDRPESSPLTPLNFKVPEAFHREFKLCAVQQGMSMVDLLQEAFRTLRAKGYERKRDSVI